MGNKRRKKEKKEHEIWDKNNQNEWNQKEI